MKYAFIEQEFSEFPVAVACEALEGLGRLLRLEEPEGATRAPGAGDGKIQEVV